MSKRGQAGFWTVATMFLGMVADVPSRAQEAASPAQQQSNATLVNYNFNNLTGSNTSIAPDSVAPGLTASLTREGGQPITAGSGNPTPGASSTGWPPVGGSYNLAVTNTTQRSCFKINGLTVDAQSPNAPFGPNTVLGTVTQNGNQTLVLAGQVGGAYTTRAASGFGLQICPGDTGKITFSFLDARDPSSPVNVDNIGLSGTQFPFIPPPSKTLVGYTFDKLVGPATSLAPDSVVPGLSATLTREGGQDMTSGPGNPSPGASSSGWSPFGSSYNLAVTNTMPAQSICFNLTKVRADFQSPSAPVGPTSATITSVQNGFQSLLGGGLVSPAFATRSTGDVNFRLCGGETIDFKFAGLGASNSSDRFNIDNIQVAGFRTP